ncbi:MAG: hypothetical protein ACMXYG_06005 [Candidatus Woesearchaeota archaeon]
MDKNKIELLLEKVEQHIDMLYKCSNDEIVEIIKELRSEPSIWNQIPSGNRKYLEAVVDNPTDNYCKGAIPHLTQALSHRMGFIASKLKHEVITGDADFDAVIMGKRSITDLNEVKLIQFLRDFANSERVRKYVANRLNIKTVEGWLETYDRKHAKDVSDAHSYIRSKRDKIYNLLVKSMLPNMMGNIARQRKSLFG